MWAQFSDLLFAMALWALVFSTAVLTVLIVVTVVAHALEVVRRWPGTRRLS